MFQFYGKFVSIPHSFDIHYTLAMVIFDCIRSKNAPQQQQQQQLIQWHSIIQKECDSMGFKRMFTSFLKCIPLKRILVIGVCVLNF